MRVIESKDLSREGNDCWIYESVSLCEEFDRYFILRCYRATGSADYEQVSTSEFVYDLVEAMEIYKKAVNDI